MRKKKNYKYIKIFFIILHLSAFTDEKYQALKTCSDKIKVKNKSRNSFMNNVRNQKICWWKANIHNIDIYILMLNMKIFSAYKCYTPDESRLSFFHLQSLVHLHQPRRRIKRFDAKFLCATGDLCEGLPQREDLPTHRLWREKNSNK